MNLNILSNEEMMGVSAEWLDNPQILAELSKDPLGLAVHNKIQSAHGSVAEQTRLRAEIDSRLTGLNGRLQSLDFTHDRKARALHNLLAALAEATNDEERAALYNQIRALLFPEALRIITRPYMYEAGAVAGLEHRVTPDVLRVLDSVRVGEQTLADIYQEWVDAGKALGKTLQERARVQASVSGEGTQVSTSRARKVRAHWIRAVRLLLDSIELLPLSEDARESILAPLEHTINEAILRRAGNGLPPVPGDDTDIDPDLDADTGDFDDLDPTGAAAELASLDDLDGLAEVDDIAADPSIA